MSLSAEAELIPSGVGAGVAVACSLKRPRLEGPLRALIRRAAMQNESTYHKRLHALVEEALELAAHEQDEALIRLAGGDLRLLADARKMLAVMGEDGAFGEDELMERRGQLEAALDSAVNASESELDELAPLPGSEGWIPSTIGPYSIRHVLGRGGTGVVFAAHQARPDRAVALKVLHPSLASAESTRRLMKEADALGRLQHPGIAQIFEAGTFDVGAGDQPFLAMELIEGAGLVAHAETASLSIRQRMDLVARICDAVEHAHSRGVVHRDLKPENIIVTEDGQPKLVDFGIASVARDSAVSAHGLTTDGQVLGTVAYMAPEQARATRNADWRLADVFSIGAIAFELVTGTRPRQLEGLSLTQVISEITGSDIPSARKLNSTLSRDIDTIIGKATMSEPRSRYQTVAALRADIRRTLQERTILARAPGKFEKAAKFTRRNRTLVASALAIALALVTGTVIALVQARAAQRAETESINKLYAAEMLLASQSVMQPVTRARTWEYVERWEGGDVPLGWEWHLLASVRRLNVVALDVSSGPYGVAWRPDGRAVAVSTANRLGVFDPDSGDAISVVDLESSDCLMQGIVWADDGERLVCGGLGMLLMWEPGTRSQGGEPSAGRVLWKQPISGIKAPLWNGRSDTVVCLDTTLKCFDAETGELRSELPFKGTNANGPRLSPNGEFVCSWDYRGYLTRRLDDWSIAVKAALPLPEPRGQAWHPSGDRIAHAGIDGVVRVLDAQSGAEMLRIDEFYEAAYSVDWHPTENLLLASGEDGTVRTFDAENGSVRQVLLRHQSVVEEARWSPNGDRVASVAVNGEALVWSLDERPALRSWYDPSLRVDDRRASLEPVEGEVAFKVVTHEMWRTYGLDSNVPGPFELEVGGVVVSGSGVWHASDGESGVSIARVDSTSGGVSAFTVPIGPQPRLCKAWSPSSEKGSPGKDALLALGGDGLWRIEPQEDGPPVSTRIADAPSDAYELAWSPDASMVCISRKAHGVRIVDADSGDTIMEQSFGDQLGCSAAHWSADSTQVALACADGALRSIRASSGEVLRTWRGHANQVEGVAWSPDGLRIAGGSRDRTVKVWDTSSGDVVASFDCKGAVADVLWLAEGAVLAAVDVDGHSYAWDARRSLNGAD